MVSPFRYGVDEGVAFPEQGKRTFLCSGEKTCIDFGPSHPIHSEKGESDKVTFKSGPTMEGLGVPMGHRLFLILPNHCVQVNLDMTDHCTMDFCI